MVVTYCWFCPFVYWVLAELFSDAWGEMHLPALIVWKCQNYAKVACSYGRWVKRWRCYSSNLLKSLAPYFSNPRMTFENKSKSVSPPSGSPRWVSVHCFTLSSFSQICRQEARHGGAPLSSNVTQLVLGNFVFTSAFSTSAFWQNH